MRKQLPAWANDRQRMIRAAGAMSALAMLAGVVSAGETPPAQPDNLPAASTEGFFDTSGGAVNAGKPFVLGASLSPIVDDPHTVLAVRCWQKGQLIVDEAGWSAPQLATHFVALRRPKSAAPGLYLVDLQDTFCELKQR